MSVMLYKHPGKHNIHGDKFDHITVEEDEVTSTLKKGWSRTTSDALNKKTKKTKINLLGDEDGMDKKTANQPSI